MKTLPNDGVSADIENLDSLNDEALARLAQNGSSDAEHTLVIRFMPLVRIKARPYFLIGADHSDLVQEALRSEKLSARSLPLRMYNPQNPQCRKSRVPY